MINIIGIIGENVKLLDVIAAAKKDTEKELKVFINSPGGYVEDGMQIYEFLKNYKEKPVKTICSGECASIATIIFMAGHTRLAGCDLMIHNPWTSPTEGVAYESKDLKAQAEELDEIKDSISQVYTSVSKIDKKTLSALMDSETYISAKRAVELGFATGKYKAKPLAMVKNSQIKNEIKMSKKNQKNNDRRPKSLYERIRNLLSSEVFNIELTDANGNVFSVDREEGEVQVGDTASPDGTFVMPDGITIVVSEGVVSEIIEPGEGETVEELQTEIEELREELEEALNKKKEAFALLAEVGEELDKIRPELQALRKKNKTSSTYTPQQRAFNGKKMTPQEESEFMARIKEKKNELKNNK